jgi:hypothetical protein
MPTRACFGPASGRADGGPADQGGTGAAAAGAAEVLEHAIRLGGSSVSDYVDADGVRGFFQLEHCVYLRTGLALPALRRRRSGGFCWLEEARTTARSASDRADSMVFCIIFLFQNSRMQKILRNRMLK